MRHRRMLAPINSNKHYVSASNTAIASAAVANVEVVESVSAPASGTTFEVEEGSMVKAIHYEYWLSNIGATGTNTQFVAIIEKVQTGGTPATAAQMVNLGSYANKKNILWSSQGVLGTQVDGSNSVPIIRDWIMVPKGKQRMGLGDSIFFNLAPLGTAINLCGLSTYKEYR